MLSPVKTNQGTQVISAIRDISARKAMEVELAELQRRLIDSMEAERLYLAQELHDSAIQELYGITYQLKALESTLTTTGSDSPVEPKQVTGFVDSSLDSTQVVINLLRSICGELRPPALAPFGLEKAIRAYLEKLSEKQAELTIHMELANDGQSIPEHQRLALFRIFQHSVNNVIRHAEAKNLTVRWNLMEDQAVLEIEDDGRGFELPTRWIKLAREGHLGLVGTLERAQAIGGQLHISTSPGQGTLIQVTVPRTNQT
jgi:signal transduction histidine kinase